VFDRFEMTYGSLSIHRTPMSFDDWDKVYMVFDSLDVQSDEVEAVIMPIIKDEKAALPWVMRLGVFNRLFRKKLGIKWTERYESLRAIDPEATSEELARVWFASYAAEAAGYSFENYMKRAITVWNSAKIVHYVTRFGFTSMFCALDADLDMEMMESLSA